MATRNYTGFVTKTIGAATSNNAYNIKDGAHIFGGGDDTNIAAYAIIEGTLTSKNTFNIDGEVIGSAGGIASAGLRTRINIGDTGMVSGNYGVILGGQQQVVSNDGTIIGATAGINMLEATEQAQIRNHGIISGTSGISINEHGASIVNGAKGIIVGLTGGVVTPFEVPGAIKLVNHGTIETTVKDGVAVALGSNDDTFVNDGKVIGFVVLGGGNDTLDTRGGSVSGNIYGYNGDDTLITDNAKHTLLERSGEGTDTVKSSVTYTLSDNVESLVLTGSGKINGTGNAGANTLSGNSGNNTLRGGAGNDLIAGNKGTDKLYGEADSDIFHFATGDGKDTVMDFELGVDQLDLSDWTAIASFEDLLDNHAVDKGDDVMIWAGKDSLLIKNVNKADFDALDFTDF